MSIVTLLAKKLSAFYGTRSFITMLTRVRHWTISSARWMQSTSSNFIYFLIEFDIPPCTCMSPTRSLNTILFYLWNMNYDIFSSNCWLCSIEFRDEYKLIERKGYRMNRSWSNLKYYRGIFMKELRKPTKNLIRHSRPSDRHLNPGPPVHKNILGATKTFNINAGSLIDIHYAKRWLEYTFRRNPPPPNVI
jgi:hypothetical protein